MGYPTILPRSARVLEEVSGERLRQDNKWGEQNHPNGTGDDVALLHGHPLPRPHQGVSVTMGSLCHVARNVTDIAAEHGTVTFADILLEEVGEALAEADPKRLREELIQVAAVAVAWVERIDRAARVAPCPCPGAYACERPRACARAGEEPQPDPTPDMA